MSWNTLWLILSVFTLLIFAIVWFARKGRKKSSGLNRLRSPSQIKKRTFIFLAITIFLLAVGGFLFWRFFGTPEELTPQQKHAKYFIENVLPNVKEVLSEDIFIEKIENHEIEIIYGRFRPEESGAMIEFYSKLRDREGFYLTNVKSNFVLNVQMGLDMTQMAVDTYIAQIEEGIPIYAVPTNPKYPRDMFGLYVMIGFLVVFILLMWFLWGRMARGGLGGFSKFKKREMGITKVTFEDIAGVDEAKREFREVIDFFKNRENYQLVKARIPKGVLLIGPPGCGKTMMAEAAANELGASYLSLSGSELVEMFVGVGAARVRDLFEKAQIIAQQTGLCLLFIDEVDALGAKRGARLDGGNDERQTTTNEIMIQMDGIGSDQRIIVIAATNRPDILDEAFTRPGRFDRKIVVTYPNVRGREAMLRVHTKDKPIASDVDFAELAKTIPLGSSGADIANIVNEAAILAGRYGKKQIGGEDFKKARDKIRFGLEKEGEVTTDDEKKSYAYHEAGHALVAKLLSETDLLGKVSIVRRGMTHGLVEILPKEDRNIRTKQDLLNDITIALASVAAEEEVFGAYGVTTGASVDIEQATKIAAAMVSVYGMSEEFGLISLRALLESTVFPSLTKEMMDAVGKINTEAKNKAKELIRTNRLKLDALAEALIDLEDIDGKMAEKIIEEGKYPLS